MHFAERAGLAGTFIVMVDDQTCECFITRVGSVSLQLFTKGMDIIKSRVGRVVHCNC